MAYCRYNGDPAHDEEYCDIYLYGDITHNAIVCFGCSLNNDEDILLKKRSDAIHHMIQHRSCGHKAPYDYIIDRLHEEIKKDGDNIDYENTDMRQ